MTNGSAPCRGLRLAFAWTRTWRGDVADVGFERDITDGVWEGTWIFFLVEVVHQVDQAGSLKWSVLNGSQT